MEGHNLTFTEPTTRYEKVSNWGVSILVAYQPCCSIFKSL